VNEQDLKNIEQGVLLTGQMAQLAAPVVSIYNPAAGAVLSQVAPLVTQLTVIGGKIILELNRDMSRDDVIRALASSRSDTWGEMPSLERK